MALLQREAAANLQFRNDSEEIGSSKIEFRVPKVCHWKQFYKPIFPRRSRLVDIPNPEIVHKCFLQKKGLKFQ